MASINQQTGTPIFEKVFDFDEVAVSTADEPSDRAGDFLIGDVVIHVTTSPTEKMIGDCGKNLNDGYRPMLVTLQRGLTVAERSSTSSRRIRA